MAREIGSARLYAEPFAVELRVYPESVTVDTGATVQFYAAVQMSDGQQLCTDADSLATAEPWTNPECYDAVALLAPYEPQDTPFVRFSWDTINSNRYDSLFYHVVIRTGDSTTFVDEIPVRHPLTSTDWYNGIPDSTYEVQAYANAYFNYAGRDTFAAGPAGPWTRFGYPEPYPVPVIMGPVTVDTLTGGGL